MLAESPPPAPSRPARRPPSSSAAPRSRSPDSGRNGGTGRGKAGRPGRASNPKRASPRPPPGRSRTTLPPQLSGSYRSSHGLQGGVEVTTAAQGALQLARRSLGQGARGDQHDLGGRDAHGG